jgi:hypothetical protein
MISCVSCSTEISPFFNGDTTEIFLNTTEVLISSAHLSSTSMDPQNGTIKGQYRNLI